MQKATKKQIVVALTAAAFAAPAFADNANVTIYGIADVSYDFISTGTSAAGVAGLSKGVVSSNVSRLGLKGAEDLGDGLSAIWQIEQQINIDNSANSTTVPACTALPCPATTVSANNGIFATRNTFAGLKSESAGTILLGRHDTPYKLATRKLDVFADSIADNRSIMGFKGAFDSRPTDVLAYISPEMGGFTGAIAYANLAEGNTTGAAAKASALSASGMFKTGPFYAGLGYQEHNTSNLTGAKTSAWKLGMSYDIDALTLGLVYEKTSDTQPTTGVNRDGHNAYYLAGNYKMGMSAIKVAYGKAGQLAGVANSSGNQFSLGYDHGLSKRTKVYAIYSRISNQSGATYAFSQSTAAASSANGAGSSPSVLSLGLKHTF